MIGNRIEKFSGTGDHVVDCTVPSGTAMLRTTIQLYTEQSHQIVLNATKCYKESRRAQHLHTTAPLPRRPENLLQKRSTSSYVISPTAGHLRIHRQQQQLPICDHLMYHVHMTGTTEVTSEGNSC
ncbi:hypothetical protein Aduo_018848 [Ancylostoma duodenale]